MTLCYVRIWQVPSKAWVTNHFGWLSLVCVVYAIKRYVNRCAAIVEMVMNPLNNNILFLTIHIVPVRCSCPFYHKWSISTRVTNYKLINMEGNILYSILPRIIEFVKPITFSLILEITPCITQSVTFISIRDCSFMWTM